MIGREAAAEALARELFVAFPGIPAPGPGAWSKVWQEQAAALLAAIERGDVPGFGVVDVAGSNNDGPVVAAGNATVQAETETLSEEEREVLARSLGIRKPTGGFSSVRSPVEAAVERILASRARSASSGLAEAVRALRDEWRAKGRDEDSFYVRRAADLDALLAAEGDSDE